MKVLLATPPVTKNRNVYNLVRGDADVVTAVLPPFNLLYLSAYLKREGHRVFFSDGFFSRLDEVLSAIGENNIDVVGLSCVTYEWEWCKTIIRRIKEKHPTVIIVLGGAHASAYMEKCLRECDELDVLVYGEGELTFSEILRMLEDGRGLQGIHGTILRDNGKIVVNEPRQLVENLDDLPFPDRDIISLRKYAPSPHIGRATPHTMIFGSRGCSYGCLFCHSNSTKMRFRSVGNIVDEMEEVVGKYRIKDITFFDETLTVDRQRVVDLCNAIIRRGINVTWSANARVDEVDLELLRLMKKAGCWRILYGVESGVQKNLNILRKGITLEKARTAIKLTKESGIEGLGFFTFGIPGETYEDGLATIDFACSVGLDLVYFTSLTPFPGTKLYEIAQKTGSVKDFSKMTMFLISYIPESLTEDQLIDLLDLAYRRFYFRSSYIIKRFFRMRSASDLIRNIRGAFLAAGLFLYYLRRPLRG